MASDTSAINDAALNKKKLSIIGLKAYYFTNKGTVKAVDDISFSIKEDESVGIAGESACGKSSLGAALLRTIQSPGKIVAGDIILDGINIVKLSNSAFDKTIRWKKIAMIFQGAMNSLDPVYTVADQMREIMVHHGIKSNIEEKIIHALKEVRLDASIAKKYPHELSGGMKQRVIIAMSLILTPDVIIADEPTTALDVLVQAQIINLLKTLKKQNRMTIILITHDLSIISEIADKIGIMYAGQLVEFGDATEIYKNPRHPYTKALISAIPLLNSDKKQISFIKGTPPSLINSIPGCRFYARCPHAMDICKQDPPEIKTETGYTRCWLYK